jgi:TonB family protein
MRRDVGSRRARLGAALTGVALFAARSLGADELEKLLKRPLSAGAVAMLVPYAAAPAASERLAAALKSPDAAVRGAAARVANVAAAAGLADGVAEALRSEGDARAALEEMRMLVSIRGAPADATVLDAARRFAPALDGPVLEIYARARGMAAVAAYFDAFRELAATRSTLHDFFRIATRGQADSLAAAAALALGRRDAAAWQAVLSVASELGHPLTSNVVQAALGSGQIVFRGEAAWYLAKSYSEAKPSNTEELLAALGDGPTSDELAADPEMRFGAEILRRVLGRPPVEDPGWISCLESSTTCHLDTDFAESPLLAYLTAREREAVVRRNEANRPPELKSSAIKRSDFYSPESETLVRLVGGIPDGVARGLLELEGCASGPAVRYFSVANVEFRRDGIPRHVAIGVEPRGGACHRTASALFLMSLAPESVTDPSAVGPAPYVATFNPKSFACTGPGPDASNDVVRVRGRVVAPTLVQRVEPVYPYEARKAGEHGVSVYEAIISRAGCIEDLRLISTSKPRLDLNGLEAISQWTYRPATVDGRPVRVYLTVTVTYRLN